MDAISSSQLQWGRTDHADDSACSSLSDLLEGEEQERTTESLDEYTDLHPPQDSQVDIIESTFIDIEWVIFF